MTQLLTEHEIEAHFTAEVDRLTGEREAAIRDYRETISNAATGNGGADMDAIRAANRSPQQLRADLAAARERVTLRAEHDAALELEQGIEARQRDLAEAAAALRTAAEKENAAMMARLQPLFDARARAHEAERAAHRAMRDRIIAADKLRRSCDAALLERIAELRAEQREVVGRKSILLQMIEETETIQARAEALAEQIERVEAEKRLDFDATGPQKPWSGWRENTNVSGGFNARVPDARREQVRLEHLAERLPELREQLQAVEGEIADVSRRIAEVEAEQLEVTRFRLAE